MKGANTTEADPKTKFPVVHVMPEQAEYLAKKQYGGTIRLGAWPCKLEKGTKLAAIYAESNKMKDASWKGENKDFVYERHRHRYEFNNEYRKDFEKAGLVFSGLSPDGKLVEAIELKDHPFFCGNTISSGIYFQTIVSASDICEFFKNN